MSNACVPFCTRIALLCLVALSCWPTAAAETNVPPPSQIFVRGASATWLDFTNVFILRRAQRTATALFDFGGETDGEGEQLYFQWYLGEVLASEAPQFSNDFEAGLHGVYATVTDNHELAIAETTIEVITPLDAIRRLHADVELTGVREKINHLRPSLRLAEGAIKHRRWAGAERQLEVFGRRLSHRLNFDLPEDVELYNRWHGAAGDLWQAVRRVPRHPSTNPGGVFPTP